MDHVSGGDLDDYYEYGGGSSSLLDSSNFLDMMRQLIRGLKVLRENGIVHNDIKEENILVEVTKEGYPIFKIADYGGACFEKNIPHCEGGLVNNGVFLSVPRLNLYLADGISSSSFLPFLYDSDLWSIGMIYYLLANGDMLPYEIENIPSKKAKYDYWINNPVTADFKFSGSTEDAKLINDVITRILYLPEDPLSLDGRPDVYEIFEMLGGDYE